MDPKCVRQIGHILDIYWTHFGHLKVIWTTSSVAGKMSKRCPNYVQTIRVVWMHFGHKTQSWTLFGHHLDTFQTSFGHIGYLDIFQTCIGHFLDIFWTLSSILCPKHVHTYILKEHLDMDENITHTLLMHFFRHVIPSFLMSVRERH